LSSSESERRWISDQKLLDKQSTSSSPGMYEVYCLYLVASG